MIEVLKQALDALEKVKHRAVVMGSTGDYREGQLDALKAVSEDVKPAIASLQQAIAELESQEPVAWRTFDGEGQYEYRAYEENESYADEWDKRNPNHKGWVDPLYTHPPQRTEPKVCCQQYDTCLEPCTPRGMHLAQRTWVGLTDEDKHYLNEVLNLQGRFPIIEAIEAKLKEKNT
jgi:hypothetical protein